MKNGGEGEVRIKKEEKEEVRRKTHFTAENAERAEKFRFKIQYPVDQLCGPCVLSDEKDLDLGELMQRVKRGERSAA